ncbi:PQQ-dependent sugar dehydrogenase [Allokutzneria sp. A3M-2-11 16]|uniref:PQQ-dependent sugar dehydrogenase n=1 Tax=Allokutzneria sp. A3M-2-11 16 TaxID=2962043 RepID=UPI0020B88D9A|nr:PQQ-dependent sugar dehydrogenase [Allokutzneria sp. A3M-2-11 16]MCP3798105.1 PQQ-dependent sugar dehydrogenase [Allokutzneria sp. A3M-2-11 16]
MTTRSRRSRGAAVLAAVSAFGLLAAGCASFPEQPRAQWTPRPHLEPQAGPNPQMPGGGGNPNQRPPRQGPSGPPKPPEGCKDYSPAVMATCLDPISAVAVLPDGKTAFVAERTTGRVLRTVEGTQDTTLVAELSVDTTGDGGLTGLALSPSFREDNLIYAYITTSTDNRVVRIAPKDSAKPVLTGIPRGSSNNAGALTRDRNGALLVATGNAGNAAAANDPNSLAGKLLRIDSAGKPASGNPTSGSAVVASGLHSPGGICTSLTGQLTWVTDRQPDRDVAYKFSLGKPLGAPAWSWPDKPGVAGCAAYPDLLSVNLEKGEAMFDLTLGPTGAFTGQPVTREKGTFGRLRAGDLTPDGAALWVGTTNKGGGKPVSSDDRAVIIIRQSGGNGVD